MLSTVADHLFLDQKRTIRVPGSSANLGPGFDALGLALAFHDVVTAEATSYPTGNGSPGAEVVVNGSGQGRVGVGEAHLVVRSIRALWVRAGLGLEGQPSLRLTCQNGVPFGRGIGSSAAAVVAGVELGRALMLDPVSVDASISVATELEGHPDNAAASLLGGMTLGWIEPSGARAVRIDPHPDLTAVVCIPHDELSTAKARAMLPDMVSHRDASFTAGRAALLVEAVTRRPDLLLEGTEDRLHQAQRASAMPRTAAMLTALRHQGLAATVSGAGPSILILGLAGDDVLSRTLAVVHQQPEQWDVSEAGIDLNGATRVDTI